MAMPLAKLIAAVNDKTLAKTIAAVNDRHWQIGLPREPQALAKAIAAVDDRRWQRRLRQWRTRQAMAGQLAQQRVLNEGPVDGVRMYISTRARGSWTRKADGVYTLDMCSIS